MQWTSQLRKSQMARAVRHIAVRWSPAQRPPHVLTARRSDDVAVVVDQSAAQKRALHPTGKFLPLERRISLLGFRLRSPNHKAFMWVDESDVGVETGSDIPLAEKAEALGRLEAQ